MKEKSILMGIAVYLLVVALGLGVSSCATRSTYDVHDMAPELLPPVITPADRAGQPPSDAVILFDGKDTSQWESDKKGGDPVKWKVENGYMEITRKAGSIRTKKSFGNCQLHIEWASPEKFSPEQTGQKRGNSGVFLMSKYEVQILDSYTESNYADNRTYADGQAASLYGQYPPLVNACHKPGQWQTYDIIFLRPKFDRIGKLIRLARITILHNGVVVHNNVEIQGATVHKKRASYQAHPDKLPITLQDHGDPIRYRNIWVRELPEQ